MPELRSFPETKVRDLKDRDLTTYGRVVGTDVKIKWALVTFEGQAGHYTERLLADQVIGCSREVPTEDEVAAKQLQRTLQALDFKEDSARHALVAARETMIKSLEAGERSSHWNWMDVPLAEAAVELWDAATHVHKVHAQADTPLTRVEAVRLVKDERTRQALSYFRATSRSTSTVSNLFDDLKTEALSNWMRELEWIVD